MSISYDIDVPNKQVTLSCNAGEWVWISKVVNGNFSISRTYKTREDLISALGPETPLPPILFDTRPLPLVPSEVYTYHQDKIALVRTGSQGQILYFYKYIYPGGKNTFEHLLLYTPEAGFSYQRHVSLEFLQGLLPDYDDTTYVSKYTSSEGIRKYLEPNNLGICNDMDHLMYACVISCGRYADIPRNATVIGTVSSCKIYKTQHNIYVPQHLLSQYRVRYLQYVETTVLPRLRDLYVGRRYHLAMTIDGPIYDDEKSIRSNVWQFFHQYNEIVEQYDVTITGVVLHNEEVRMTLLLDGGEEGHYLVLDSLYCLESLDIMDYYETTLVDSSMRCGGYSFAAFPQEDWEYVKERYVLPPAPERQCGK